ncbi:hypothetical protein V8E52_008231 [Russula decolorans]|jgi:hypothetical protein
MRTSSLAFLVFLSTAVANAAVLREHPQANAQAANDRPRGLPPRDGSDPALRPRLSSLHSQRRTSDENDNVPVRVPRRHRRRHAHV